MRIAVIADTHNHLPNSVRAELVRAEQIWHLGDICNREILAAIRALGPFLHAVAGNCDPRGLAPESLFLRLDGKTFFLVHQPPHIAPEGVDFVLHGHTHVPRDEHIGSVRFLNPGAVGKANRGAAPAFAWLETGENRDIVWSPVSLPRERG